MAFSEFEPSWGAQYPQSYLSKTLNLLRVVRCPPCTVHWHLGPTMTWISNPQTAVPIAALCCVGMCIWIPIKLALRQRCELSSIGSSRKALEHSAGADPVMAAQAQVLGQQQQLLLAERSLQHDAQQCETLLFI